jgi:creatinine amidohydrolase
MLNQSYSPSREPTHRYIGRLTAPEIETHLSPSSVLCLPIGAYEQHGPHLPIYTDTILAEGFAHKVIARWGDHYDIWLLPTIPYGLSREHAWSAGTLSLSVRVFSDLVLTLVEEMSTAVPARNLLIINGHGGNRGILEALVYEIERRSSLNVCVTHPTALSKVRSGSLLPEVHGGMSETSVMLALANNEVHMERLPESYHPDESVGEAIRHLIVERGTTWPWTSEDSSIASFGIIGDPRKANPDLGRCIIESAVEEYGKVLSCLIARGKENEQR